MQHIATGSVAWCVYVSVCWSRSLALQKRLNRSRCSFCGWLGCAQRTMYYMEVQIPQGEEEIFWGLFGPLKSIVSHRCSVRSKKSQ